MYPPVYSICAAVTAVTDLIGPDPVRLYPHDEAPQNVAAPYATWSIVSGLPEHMLDEVPDTDQWIIQVTAYGKTEASVRSVAEALRDAIEPHGDITFRGTGRDPDTREYTYIFDVDWAVAR